MADSEKGGMMMNSGIKQLFAYSWTMMLLSLPCGAFAQAQTGGDTEQTTQDGASGDDAVYCRPPQQRADFRMMGPKVCMTVRKWNELHARGLDVGPDGHSIVPFYSGAQISGAPMGMGQQP